MSFIKALALSILTAALLLVGIYFPGWFWCSWLAWVLLFFLAESLAGKPGTFCGLVFLAGLVYYGIENAWLLLFQIPLFLAAAFLLALTMTLYFALYRFLAGKLRADSLKIVCAALLWIVFQYAIRLTPFTTVAFEAPFYGPLELFQIAAFVDFSVLGALVMGLSLALVLFIRKRSLHAAFWTVLLSACLAGLYIWGHYRLQAEVPQGKFKAALIQHNIPISGQWRLDHPDEIRARYKRLAREAAASKPDLIVFPLYTLPDDPLRQPEFLSSLAKETNTMVLAASHVPKTPEGSILKEGYLNIAVLFSPSGKLLDYYHAVQKPPTFSPVKEHLAKEYKVLDSPLGKIGILLCYEDTKPQVAEEAVKKGADILIALSNPGFFSKTPMPYYHLIQDRLRAVETGRTLLRVSPNGYTAQIDRFGRFIRKSVLEKEEILIAEI